MRLTDEAMADMVMLEKTGVPDGEGGLSPTAWEPSTAFTAAVTFDSSIEARAAEKQGVTSLYTVTTDKSIALKYHDIFKRLSDGKIFRVTSDGDDRFTPDSASLNMRQVSAEEWSLT